MIDCIHETSAERRCKNRDGSEVIVLQCMLCGARIRNVSKEGRIMAKLDWFDPLIAEAWDLRRKTEFELLERQRAEDQRNRIGQWWDAYSDYLQSDQWKHVRRTVLQRDRACQKCFEAPATEAHHLTYETFTNRGFSYPAECVGLCHECHRAETAASRSA